jgi:hypothetical protein
MLSALSPARLACALVGRRLVVALSIGILMTGLPAYASARDKIDQAALKKVKAATVYIRVTLPDGDISQGSGFVTISKGLIVTNAHVVGMLDNDSAKPSKIEVTFNSGEQDSKTVEVRVAYVDGDSDLALLVMAAGDLKLVPDLLPIFLSHNLTETQDVCVVGFPLGKQAGSNVTVTATTVTALRKEGPNMKQVQVNGGMHPGNSGGPVVDTEGRLVGIAEASYAGTQLHLAIPTESLNAVTNGRVLNSTFGVPYHDGDKLKVPFRFEKADPLGRMKSISIENWIGKPGPTRGTSTTKPEALPDDSPITVLEVKPDAKGVYAGELVLDEIKDPGLVYWNRYQVGRGGDKILWYPGGILNAARQPAVDRKPLTFKFDPPVDSNDALSLNSESGFRIRIAGSADVSLAMIVKGLLHEKVTNKANDGKAHKRITYDGIETTLTEDKKPLEDAGPLLKALKDAKSLASEVDVDSNGTVARHMIDNSKTPRASRDALELVSDQVEMSLDSLAFPIPAKEVAARDTWKGQQTYALGTLGLAVQAKAEVTYRYEGTYMRGDKPMAVVTFEGQLVSNAPKAARRGAKAPNLTGTVEGKITIAADTGVIQSANEKIRAEIAAETKEGKPVKAIGTLNVSLTRVLPAPPKKN